MASFSGNKFAQALLNTLTPHASVLTLNIGFNEADSSTHAKDPSLQQLTQLREYEGWTDTPLPNPSNASDLSSHVPISAQFHTSGAVGQATWSVRKSLLIPAKFFFRTAISACESQWKRAFVRYLKESRFNGTRALMQLGDQVVHDLRQQLMNHHESEDPALAALDERLSHALTWQVHER